MSDRFLYVTVVGLGGGQLDSDQIGKIKDRFLQSILETFDGLAGALAAFDQSEQAWHRSRPNRPTEAADLAAFERWEAAKAAASEYALEDWQSIDPREDNFEVAVGSTPSLT